MFVFSRCVRMYMAVSEAPEADVAPAVVFLELRVQYIVYIHGSPWGSRCVLNSCDCLYWDVLDSRGVRIPAECVFPS